MPHLHNLGTSSEAKMPQISLLAPFAVPPQQMGSATFRKTDLSCAAGEATGTEGITEKNAVCCNSISNDLASLLSEAVQQLPLP